MEVANLCGQNIYTVEVFRPLRNIYNTTRFYAPAAVTRAGLDWLSSSVYRYPHLMLMVLTPATPAVQGWPCYSWPPPHLLVGYQYLVLTCNDYAFDDRTLSRISYRERQSEHFRAMDWQCLANCAYTVNVGAYLRFLDVDDFENSLMAMQQALIGDRIVADLQMANPMRGLGRWNLPGQEEQDREEAQQEQQETPSLASVLSNRYRRLAACGPSVWGLSRRAHRAITPHNTHDLAVLAAIRDLRSAYYRYLLADAAHSARDPHQPSVDLPLDSRWLTRFVEIFSRDPASQPDEQPGPSSAARERQAADWRALPNARDTLACAIDAIALPCPLPPTVHSLVGGAVTLRPRDPVTGRAMTAAMRRARGEAVQQFIDSLPIPRRRRRPREASPPPSPPEPEMMPPEHEDEDDEEYDDEYDEEGRPRSPSPRDFRREVRAAVSAAIAALQEELTDAARDDSFFAFNIDFYQAMLRLDQLNDINETTLQRWVMYFFICEHIATTLNYLHSRLRLQPIASRHLRLLIGQVVMRARDRDGEVIFSRVWNENGDDALRRVMARITRDLAATVERAGIAEIDDADLEAFMEDIAYQDNSGDVEEIVRQVTMNDSDVDSVELSFRCKLQGPVAFTNNQVIRDLNRRVVLECERLAAAAQPLPQLHAPHGPLPPLPPAAPVGPRPGQRRAPRLRRRR